MGSHCSCSEAAFSCTHNLLPRCDVCHGITAMHSAQFNHWPQRENTENTRDEFWLVNPKRCSLCDDKDLPRALCLLYASSPFLCITEPLSSPQLERCRKASASGWQNLKPTGIKAPLKGEVTANYFKMPCCQDVWAICESWPYKCCEIKISSTVFFFVKLKLSYVKRSLSFLTRAH